MKALCLLLVVAALTSVGCATPAYSSHERSQLISRNWNYEWKQLQDDTDDALLLRPASMMTMWNVH